MKKFIFIFVMFFVSFTFLYGQNILFRSGGSVGYCSADDMKGLSYTYGIKILLMANEFQRYGIKIDHLNILSDEKSSYMSAGLFIEQVVFKYFNMGIGTVGYINTIQWGENPFGLYTHLGFEYNFNNRINIVAAYQSDFIFRREFTMNNGFLLEIGLNF